MQSFKTWFEQEEFVEFVNNSMNQQPVAKAKPWSAKKDEILHMWQQMRPDAPIIMTPMAPSMPGAGHSSYGEDGVRITGSYNFIAGVLGKLKSLMSYENPGMKLRLVFRAVDSNKVSRPDRQAYVFYVNLQPRSKGRPGRKMGQ